MASLKKPCPDCGVEMDFEAQHTSIPGETGADYRCGACARVWRRVRGYNATIHQLRKDRIVAMQ